MPPFRDPAATRRWHAYLGRVDRMLATAGPAAGDMREDLEAHLADSYASSLGVSEDARLAAAIERLGAPEEYLRPLVADTLIERATTRLDPVGIARGLYHGIRLGSARAVVGIAFAAGYAALFIFVAMAVLRPLWGGHVGLYRWPTGDIEFGFLKDTSGAIDMLGGWTLPAVLAAAALLYLLLTRVLRRIWKRL